MSAPSWFEFDHTREINRCYAVIAFLYVAVNSRDRYWKMVGLGYVVDMLT